ncbi:MAG: hypothetical protein FWF49_05910 [Oscillospiraceae bacterium]|nr:hypothetical protein [Oscillospiraceae bacterium]
MNDIHSLYHHYEKDTPPFRTLTALPVEQAKAVVRAGLTGNPRFDVDHYLQLRYDRDKILREKFLAIGGKPTRAAPVYFTL